MADPTVAVLGTGRMGSAMAERLADQRRARSSSTTGRRTGPTALAERIGATVAATPAEAAARADVVISMVADDAAVRDAVRRAGRGRRRASAPGPSRST